MNTTKIIKLTSKAIEELKPNSAWKRAVKQYALELLEFHEGPLTIRNLLNGAGDWVEFSYGGGSLIYDSDIAERICSPSELRKTRGGLLHPNKSEQWLDTQARALRQASNLIIVTSQEIAKKLEKQTHDLIGA